MSTTQPNTHAPYRCHAFSRVFRDGSVVETPLTTRAHADLWERFCLCGTSGCITSLLNLLNWSESPADVVKAAIPHVYKAWCVWTRRERERQELVTSYTTTWMEAAREKLANARRYVDDAGFHRAAKSLLGVHEVRPLDMMRLLQHRSEALNGERYRIEALRRTRNARARDNSLSTPEADRFARLHVERVSERARLLQVYLRRLGISAEATTALVAVLAHTVQVNKIFPYTGSTSYGQVRHAVLEGFWSVCTSGAFRSIVIGDLRDRLTDLSAGARARLSERRVAERTGDPLGLLLTDPRFLSWTDKTRKPSRLRYPLGFNPATQRRISLGAFDVRTPEGYHNVRRPTAAPSVDLCGIEIETCYKRPAGAASGIPTPRGWICESDSSIARKDEEEAAELVSPPKTWSKTLEVAQAWLDHCASEGYTLRGGHSRVCGLHVTSSMRDSSVSPLQALFKRMDTAGVYRSFTGRVSNTSHGYADPNQRGKYSPVNVRRTSGSLCLVELRAFTGPTGEPDAFMKRLKIAECLFAVCNLPNAQALLDSATADTDFLPVGLPEDFQATHAIALSAWKARIGVPVGTAI